MSVSQRDPSMVVPSVDACVNTSTSFSVLAFSIFAHFYLPVLTEESVLCLYNFVQVIDIVDLTPILREIFFFLPLI